MRVISQASMRPHVLRFPSLTLAERFRPVAERMLNWAEVAWGDPSMDRARAVVGWFAAHAVHPQAFLHPNGTSENLGVLPVSETWTTFNTEFNAAPTIARDQAYWYALFPNGITMLERLIGTVASDGAVTDNGMLTETSPGTWRIRNFADFRAPQCTLQCKMAQVILASMGIPAIDISTVGHDPMMFYEIETGRWHYIDPTFGEMLAVDGECQNPLDLLQLSLAGNVSGITSVKLPGAEYIPVGYFSSPTYPSGGMSLMTLHTAPQWAGGLSDRAPYRFGGLPSQSAANDRVGTIAELMPEMGVGVAGLTRTEGAVEVRLRSNWLGHTGFQRSTDDGTTWAACSAIDYPALSAAQARYRSVDVSGLAGMPAIVAL